MEARSAGLVLLAAPAGYGKTTTLLEWARHDRRPFAWVTLTPEDDAPGRLFAAVTRAADALTHRRTGPFVLVVDDVQVLRSAEAIDALGAIVAHPPSGAQVVLASRSEPPLPLGRLRAHRELLEMGARDFTMTRGEAAALLELAGVELGAAEVDALARRTEGWPAGLYLAALSLREQPDPAAAAARFAGDDRIVADYVADSLLASLSGEQVAFLARTSVLERLSGPLCDAVLGTTGSAAMLKELARANVLLVPLDRADQWYRYHRLLAESLRAELMRREPGLARELHRRAGQWHAGYGDPDAAIRHAIAAGDVGPAGDLLWADALRSIAQGRNATVRRRLARFDDRTLTGHAPLALVAGSAALADGRRDVAEHWVAVAARALRRGPARPQAAGLHAGVATLRAMIARDGVVAMRDDAAHARALADEDDPCSCLQRLLEGTACHLLGARERARELLQDGARRSVVAAPAVNALCLAQLALLALECDDWGLGTELASRARSRLEGPGLAEYPTMSLVLATSALTQAQLGHVDAAKADCAEAARLLEAMSDFAPWYLAETRIVLAQAALRLSDVVRARALLGEAERATSDAPEAHVLAGWLADGWARAEAYCATAASTPATLTTAELRILRLLPTHLSFREMGSRLYVSPNTVKTQAQAVYRKLDASSRSEAVARGRELGLIESQQSPV
ncbi:MAG: LuxR C-terminal-related transcriptional regulator [Solirubrobacteraceae bacterium]